MAYVRSSKSGFSVAQKVRSGDGWKEETVCWLGAYITPDAALEGFTAELAQLEEQAATEDQYLKSRDGCNDRSARWARHKLGQRIDKLRTRLECVTAYLAGVAESSRGDGGLGN